MKRYVAHLLQLERFQHYKVLVFAVVFDFVFRIVKHDTALEHLSDQITRSGNSQGISQKVVLYLDRLSH